MKKNEKGDGRYSTGVPVDAALIAVVRIAAESIVIAVSRVRIGPAPVRLCLRRSLSPRMVVGGEFAIKFCAPGLGDARCGKGEHDDRRCTVENLRHNDCPLFGMSMKCNWVRGLFFAMPFLSGIARSAGGYVRFSLTP